MACQRYFLWVIPAGFSTLTIALDLILLLRLFALYNRRKQLFAILLILVIGNSSVTLWTQIKLAKLLAATVLAMPAPWRGCTSNVPNLKFMLLGYVPNFALSLLFLALTLRKLVANYQSLYGKLTWKSFRDMNRMSPLLLAFTRDGSILFALTTLISFLGLCGTYFVVHGPMQAAFMPWILAVYSYAGAHLILGLRAVGAKGNADQTWNETLSFQYRPDGVSCAGNIRFS